MKIGYGKELIIIIYYVSCVFVTNAKNNNEQLKSELLPPCKACKTLVDSFKKGVDRTARFKFEGGDADWEEKKQVRYATSEIRLTEIQEELCNEIVKGQNQCHKLASENDENFEKWWFEEQNTNPDLFDWLCINTLQVCCSNGTYGPTCKPCPGGVPPCSNRGHCRGDGTRTGTGECRCSKGYTGPICDKCNTGFYNESVDENQYVCLECYKGCQGHCRDGSPKGCEVCANGWLHHPEFGCQDIDECASDVPVCESRQFCVNNEGSFSCLACHSSCASCFGDAPNECKECNPGFTRKGDLCMDSSQWWRSVRSNWGHYFTYLGLCVATFIVLKKSVYLASALGVVVALYIGMSEYTLSNSSPGTVTILPPND